MKKILILLICILLMGCEDKKSLVSYINQDEALISISYPITNINVLDDKITGYVHQAYNEFKNMSSSDVPELNISYTYKEVNTDIVSVSLQTEIVTDKRVNKIKTFTYNKSNDKFLTMEDIVSDLDALE